MPRTRSGLYRRKDSPFWWACYTPPGGGEPVNESTRCRDRSAADTWLAVRELERVRAEAGIPVARSVSLLIATAEYIAEKEPIWSKGWRDTVDAFVARRVLKHFGNDRSVASITRADVERFRVGEIGRPIRGGRMTSGATVNRLMAAMAAFGEWCLVEGRHYHTANPWGGHAPLPEDEAPVPDLEDEQLDRLLAALEQPTGDLPTHGRRRYKLPWRLVVEFARETGLRKSELSRLKREDIRGAVLYVISTRARGHNKARKLRPFPLSQRAREILEQLPKRDDGFVFGKIPDPRSAFRTAAKAAGLERVWLHLFRHLFASRLAERGAGRHELRDAGGWSSTRMVDRYTHARMERLAALVEGDAAGNGSNAATQPPPEKETGGQLSPTAREPD